MTIDADAASLAVAVQVLGAGIVGALGGGILTVIGQEIVRCWRHPVLNVYYEDQTEYLSEAELDWPHDKKNNNDPTPRYVVRLLRIKVLNEGRSTAKSCRAYISRISRINMADGSKQSIDNQDSIPISWSMQDDFPTRPIDIPVGIRQFADVCFTLSRDTPYKLFPTGLFPNRLREAWNKPGKFELDVVVVADDASVATKTINFEWQGPWKSLKYLSA